MDSYETTRIVFSRIQNLDPDNASKIMGYLLLQDQGEDEMNRLAFGPDILIHNLIFKARTELGLLLIPNNSQIPNSPSNSRPSPSSIAPSRFSNNGGSFDISAVSSPHSPGVAHGALSYANVVNGGGIAGNNTGSSGSESFSSLSSSAFPYYGSGVATGNGTTTNNNYTGGGSGDVVLDHEFTQQNLSFLNESSNKQDADFFDQTNHHRYSYGDSLMHRRSLSLPASAANTCLGSNILNSDDDLLSPGGWKPCMYFAKGFCKNGGTCKFVHGAENYSLDVASTINIGSPSNLNEFEQYQELLLLRSKTAAAAAAAQQQRKLALAASQFSLPFNNHNIINNNKSMNFLPQPQNDSPRSPMGFNGGFANAGARQIYLTFPADSTFREEDVSNYFSMYGPVQDVRIPYQQKRMFGFVTFVYPETVRMILAKGNPHFVCNSRVLVKPYKEKGKCSDKKQQQLERGDFSACSSPVGLDHSREPYGFNLGGRMSYNSSQEMLLRKKMEEEADLQQAIEMHGRRLMNLKLQLNLKNNSSSNNHQMNHHHQNQFHHNLTSGSPIPSPTTLSHTPRNHPLIFPLDGIDDQLPGEKDGSQNQVAESENGVSVKVTESVNSKQQKQEVNPSYDHDDDNINNGKDDKPNTDEHDLPESLEHILPDNLFASPKKSDGGDEHLAALSGENGTHDHDDLKIKTTSCNSSTSKLFPSSSSNLTMAPIQSCFLQFPRFSSEHGTIGL